MSSWMLPAVLSTWITRLQVMVDRRLRDLFPALFHGLLFTMEVPADLYQLVPRPAASHTSSAAATEPSVSRVVKFNPWPCRCSTILPICQRRPNKLVSDSRSTILLPSVTARVWKERAGRRSSGPVESGDRDRRSPCGRRGVCCRAPSGRERPSSPRDRPASQFRFPQVRRARAATDRGACHPHW